LEDLFFVRASTLVGNLALVPIYAQQRITVFIRTDAKNVPAADVPADQDTDEHNQEQCAAQAEQNGIGAICLCPNGTGNQRATCCQRWYRRWFRDEEGDLPCTNQASAAGHGDVEVMFSGCQTFGEQPIRVGQGIAFSHPLSIEIDGDLSGGAFTAAQHQIALAIGDGFSRFNTGYVEDEGNRSRTR